MRIKRANTWGKLVSLPPAYNPLELAQALLRQPSITPEGGKVLAHIERLLSEVGFVCDRIEFNGIQNLYAHLSGGKGKDFGFCGHVDVVPVGDEALWSQPPFGGRVANGAIYGRGAVDMKGAVACFVAAASKFARSRQSAFSGAISLLLTSDEEGIATDGIAKLIPYLKRHNKLPDVCLVGEPTSSKKLGDGMRIGRRGSLRLKFTVTGKAGHSAWPSRADNPIPRLTALLAELQKIPLSKGNKTFSGDDLVITQISGDGKAANVIPHIATASVNLRFGGKITGKDWTKRIRAYLKQKGHSKFKLAAEYNAEPFVCRNKPLLKLTQQAAKKHTKLTPEASCDGGTSDARFIAPHLPTVEFGLVGKTMHKTDECCPVGDLDKLTAIYLTMLENFFYKA